MCALRLSHSGALRSQWVGSHALQKPQIIIIIWPCLLYSPHSFPWTETAQVFQPCINSEYTVTKWDKVCLSLAKSCVVCAHLWVCGCKNCCHFKWICVYGHECVYCGFQSEDESMFNTVRVRTFFQRRTKFVSSLCGILQWYVLRL